MSQASRTTVLGIALEARRLVAVTAGRGAAGAPRVLELEPIGDDGRWPALAEALAALRPAGGRAALAVALLPPEAQVRPLDVPPLGATELEQLVARNAARYFLGARDPQVVGVAHQGGRTRGPRAVVAGAVPARLVDAIEHAARDAGWDLPRIVAAEASWVAAAHALWPGATRSDAHLLVPRGDRLELLRIRDGALAGVRRFRGLDADAAALREALLDPDAASARVLLLGPVAVAARVQRLTGAAVDEVPAAWAALATAPEAMAAAFAAAGGALEFLSPQGRAARRAVARRATIGVFGAAAILLLVAAALQRVALSRELQRVEDERAALRSQVAEFVATQDLVSAVERQMAELNGAVTGSPQWSRVLRSISRSLPPIAYITSLRGQADSLVVEGFATSATGVFQSLARDSKLVDVHSAAPVRSSFLDNGEPRDHFTIAAHVRGARPTPLAAPPRKAP